MYKLKKNLRSECNAHLQSIAAVTLSMLLVHTLSVRRQMAIQNSVSNYFLIYGRRLVKFSIAAYQV